MSSSSQLGVEFEEVDKDRGYSKPDQLPATAQLLLAKSDRYSFGYWGSKIR